MSDLISRKKVIDILEKEKSLRCGYDADIAIFSIEKGIRELPTAYDVDKVVEELESFAKLAEDRWTNGTSEHAYQEHKCWVKSIEIVKQDVIPDDVCEWKMDNVGADIGCRSELHHTGYVNRTNCPFCGKKIKVVQ